MKVDFELEKEIYKAAEEICYEELRSIENGMERQGGPVFSDEYRKKISKTIYGQVEIEKKGFLKNELKGRKIKHRYVLLVAILLILSASTLMAAEPVREKLVLAFYTVFQDNVEIRKDEELANSVTIKDEKMIFKKPTYVPDGYEVYEERINEEMQRITITWQDNEESILYYSQFNVNDRTISITSDGTKPESVFINANEAQMIIDKNGVRTLFYEANNCIYMISGELSKNELVKILESIK